MSNSAAWVLNGGAYRWRNGSNSRIFKQFEWLYSSCTLLWVAPLIIGLATIVSNCGHPCVKKHICYAQNSTNCQFSSSGRFTAGRSTSSSSRKRCYRQRPDCHQLRACYGMRVETEINEEKNLETRFFSCSSCKLPSSWCPRAIRPYTRSLAAIACLRLSPSAIPLTSSTNLILI